MNEIRTVELISITGGGATMTGRMGLQLAIILCGSVAYSTLDALLFEQGGHQ